MRLVPIPDSVELQPHEKKGKLGPPEGMTSADCGVAEVIHGFVNLPSGGIARSVQALVFMSKEEIEKVIECGGHFWIGFVATTFPPVFFQVPETKESEDVQHS